MKKSGAVIFCRKCLLRLRYGIRHRDGAKTNDRLREKRRTALWRAHRDGGKTNYRLRGKHTFVLRNWIMQAKYFLLGVENRRVKKKFIITLMKDPPSLKAKEKCLQSIRRHGGGKAECFAAIDKRHSESVLRKYGINWVAVSLKGSKKSKMGCFASHFLLWLKCIECDEPIMIFETDALCVRTLPSRLRFRHVINLADGNFRRNCHIKEKTAQFLDKNPYQGSVCYNSRRMPGTVAYAVSPDGARRLVKEAQTALACETDEFMEKRVVDIVEYLPLPAELNADFPSYIERSHTELLP